MWERRPVWFLSDRCWRNQNLSLGGQPCWWFPQTQKNDHISSLWGRKTPPVKLCRPNYSWTLTPKINWNGKLCMTSCWMLGMSRMTQHSLRGFGIEGDIHQSAGTVCYRSMVAVTVGWLCRQSKLLLMVSWRGKWPSTGLPQQRKQTRGNLCLWLRQQPSHVSPLSVSTVLLDGIHCEFTMKNDFSERRVKKASVFLQVSSN